MKLDRFITDHLQEILLEWTSFARKNAPPDGGMTELALRDHAAQILRAVAADIRTRQSDEEQYAKSQGEADDLNDEESAAAIHGRLRHASNFSLLQLSSEFRALRATVLRLWLPRVSAMPDDVAYEMIRFNEAIDQALAESIVTFSERGDRTRELFLAILGHDLRAPLANMALTADLLARPGAPAGQGAAAGLRIKRGVRLMSSMVDDLLGYTRTQMGGGMPLTPRAVDIADVVRHAVEDASSMFPNSDFQLQMSGELEAVADAARVHQMLTNLLINAAQYGARGKPVDVNVSADADVIVLTVRNFGQVIPADKLGSIFQPLVQLDPDVADEDRPKTSMGLGLFIAAETARAHDASITAASSESEGTVFTVRLPRAPA